MIPRHPEPFRSPNDRMIRSGETDKRGGGPSAPPRLALAPRECRGCGADRDEAAETCGRCGARYE